MRFIRILLYKTFGLKAYLKLVSSIYIKYINWGFGKTKYAELHYLKTLVKPGYICLDIGANMAYYSYFMAKYAGVTGKVYAVEPVPLFGEIWTMNMKNFMGDNLHLFPYALGEKEMEMEMGMPTVNGVVHHGMTRVISDKDTGYEKTFKANMKNPDKLFVNIAKIDFIKLDVEGYESQVFANMTETIEKHMPIIQSELSGADNRSACIKILDPIGYKPHVLRNNSLEFADGNIIKTHNGDFYFIKK